LTDIKLLNILSVNQKMCRFGRAAQVRYRGKPMCRTAKSEEEWREAGRSARKVCMAIEVKLDMMLVKRKMMLKELSETVGISMTNLSLLKTGRVKGIKFSTLEKICRELDCQPGDLLEYVAEYV